MPAALFQLTAGERAFLDAVLERGEINASTLEVPHAVRAAIEASPALRWKAQNLKARISRLRTHWSFTISRSTA
jgi:hypothetical protein